MRAYTPNMLQIAQRMWELHITRAAASQADIRQWWYHFSDLILPFVDGMGTYSNTTATTTTTTLSAVNLDGWWCSHWFINSLTCKSSPKVTYAHRRASSLSVRPSIVQSTLCGSVNWECMTKLNEAHLNSSCSCLSYTQIPLAYNNGMYFI